ncbi:hypothetical protein MSR1_23930 [Magnetospirillum gryphiswaldense MSR-1]|nr:hypothetical protein MSR1_23930 [Magnetospirillum gryphiswaldense MSR-1]AVM78779.1 hypothetical protein MSR1L_23930 [Magnetospirillum gryphiswaldense]
MDWATRKVVAWRLPNTMEADFCIEALEEALEGVDIHLVQMNALTRQRMDKKALGVWS